MQEKSIWLDDSERDTLELMAESHRDRLIIQLGTLCGLRVGEWRTLKVRDVFEREVGGETRYFLRVGQEIAKTESAVREVWLPKQVYQNVTIQHRRENLNGSDYLIPSRNGGGLSDSGARHIVKTLANRLHEETGTERFKFLSSHDLRRYHANRLVDNGVDTNILLDQMGWSSFESALPYLKRASPENVANAFDSAGLT